MTDQTLATSLLRSGLDHLKMDIPTDDLMQYLHLLDKWNKTYNLTAVRKINDMVGRHLLDSLAIKPWVKGPRILDVGTGAGLPGIPLAIAYPEYHFVLLDSNGKKTRFLQEVIRVLKLNNVEVEQTRVENYHPEQGFDTVISRAFSDLSQMTAWTHHLLAQGGQWLAMKGRYPETELDSIKHPWQVQTYSVPGQEGERCCVIMTDSGDNQPG